VTLPRVRLVRGRSPAESLPGSRSGDLSGDRRDLLAAQVPRAVTESSDLGDVYTSPFKILRGDTPRRVLSLVREALYHRDPGSDLGDSGAVLALADGTVRAGLIELILALLERVELRFQIGYLVRDDRGLRVVVVGSVERDLEAPALDFRFYLGFLDADDPRELRSGWGCVVGPVGGRPGIRLVRFVANVVRETLASSDAPRSEGGGGNCHDGDGGDDQDDKRDRASVHLVSTWDLRIHINPISSSRINPI
jgi:hypothetical protein